MKIAHILRKYNPLEWAGTETAVLNLAIGLRNISVSSKIFCPIIDGKSLGPFENEGFDVQRIKAFLPVAGLSSKQKKRLIAIGGNIFSWQLLKALWYEKDLSCIHSHALGLFGAIGLKVARAKKIPFIVSIHGGALDLPKEALKSLQDPLKGGFNWGKVLSFAFQTRSLLENADLILTCNKREKLLLEEKYPKQRIVFNPHAINIEPYSKNLRQKALEAYPQLGGKKLLLCVARIDPVKNQLWLIDQLPSLLAKNSNLVLGLVGPVTDSDYHKKLLNAIQSKNLMHAVEYLGEIPYGNEILIGLYQQASAVILASISEPFGLVILEAFAAKVPAVCTRTSGPESLILDKRNGWLFDVNNPGSFESTIQEVLSNTSLVKDVTAKAYEDVVYKYDINIAAARVKELYIDCGACL